MSESLAQMPSPLVSPALLLLIAIAITVLAAGGSALERWIRRRALAKLAKEWRMHYSPRDVFNLAPRLASKLPVPGAADVRVVDMIYGTRHEGYCYIFTAEHTTGVVRSKSRRRCVVCVVEPRTPREAPIWSSLRIAPQDRSLLEQYLALREAPSASEGP